MSESERAARALALVQAAYYAATGIWPLVHIHSFERVTGAKLEHWLVRTVGALVTVVGASLALAAREDAERPATVALGAGSAAALAAVDFVYVAKRRISPVYLADGVAQAALLAAWIRRTR